jgi:ubiquinone/menaquinone biosynthesis C-methylase UbiE
MGHLRHSQRCRKLRAFSINIVPDGAAMADPMKFFTDGNAYERMMGRWSRAVGEKFLNWLALPQGLHWLDVGCGNGAFTETLIRYSAPAKVDAVDPSSDQVSHARSRATGDVATFRLGDAQALQFSDNSFDVAVMALVISFVPDARKAVNEMRRVVRPGGTVATYMWESTAQDSIPHAPFKRAAEALGFSGTRVSPPSEKLTTQEGLQNLWREIGLEKIATTQINIKVEFNGFDNFWQSCTALPNPSTQFLRELPPSDVEKVRGWLNEQLPRDASGCISYRAYANAVKGQVLA